MEGEGKVWKEKARFGRRRQGLEGEGKVWKEKVRFGRRR